jgi:hypothetical protein
VILKINNSVLQNSDILFEQSYSSVAFAAKQPSVDSSLMAMIEREGPDAAFVFGRFRFLTYGAAMVLFIKHFSVLLKRDSKFALQIVFMLVGPLFIPILLAPRFVGFVVTSLAMSLKSIRTTRNLIEITVGLYLFTLATPPLTKTSSRAMSSARTVSANIFEVLSFNPSVPLSVVIRDTGLLPTSTLAITRSNIR